MLDLRLSLLRQLLPRALAHPIPTNTAVLPLLVHSVHQRDSGKKNNAKTNIGIDDPSSATDGYLFFALLVVLLFCLLAVLILASCVLRLRKKLRTLKQDMTENINANSRTKSLPAIPTDRGIAVLGSAGLEAEAAYQNYVRHSTTSQTASPIHAIRTHSQIPGQFQGPEYIAETVHTRGMVKEQVG
ncbi:MAG: hypothetical protein CYPHOPRED_006005 [Cyphobasidiales sp. Tagirdzhanova-0007]|nr:MAG: hypothetical protein CYPHOPRED_006005 [Cyphobasidiales sp. Tagirdzhanova-0007]